MVAWPGGRRGTCPFVAVAGEQLAVVGGAGEPKLTLTHLLFLQWTLALLCFLSYSRYLSLYVGCISLFSSTVFLLSCQLYFYFCVNCIFLFVLTVLFSLCQLYFSVFANVFFSLCQLYFSNCVNNISLTICPHLLQQAQFVAEYQMISKMFICKLWS